MTTNFLSALEKSHLSITLWPEKKKLELWPEPEPWKKFRLDDIIHVIRNEKKKVELEKAPGFERWRDPISELSNPAVYDRLVERLANDVINRIQNR